MEYQLLATDLDGTLLNSEKQISEHNIAAINDALRMGKHVIFSTGRSLGEVEDFFPFFPDMRYVLCESGSLLYDRKEQRILAQHMICSTDTEWILKEAAERDILVQIMTDGMAYLNEGSLEQLEHYQIAYFREHFRKTAVFQKDIIEECRKKGWRAEKICLYHTDEMAREYTLKKLLSLPVTRVFSEKTSLEITPLGIDKGDGLRKLCEILQIPLKATIAIGDAPNDLAVLQTAGLSIAVENASEEMKQCCDVITADNDHHGVAEAIRTYLLKE